MGRSKAKGLTAPATASLPAELEMRLFAPGMTALHRAGLGGLACTLRYIERAYRQGALSDDDVPGGPWHDSDSPPWVIKPDRVTLKFGEAGNAREYLRLLFALAFQIKDGLIYLPGQYGDIPPSLAVRVDLQNAACLTFLQHGGTRTMGGETTVQVDPNGDGTSLLPMKYKSCSDYKHQDGWKLLTTEKDGRLVAKEIKFEGPLNPGAAVRHNAFAGPTKVSDPVERLLPLHFALVGCLSLAVNRGCGVLLVPEVECLQEFVRDRPALTPRTPAECRITGTGDAVLQALARLRGRSLAIMAHLPGVLAARLAPTTWAKQQKSRVAAFRADTSEAHQFAGQSEADLALDRFELVLAVMPPRVYVPPEKPASGPKKRRDSSRPKRDEAEEKGPRWVDSHARPLIADNLATGRRWYDGFAKLAATTAGVKRLTYDRGGLQAMADKPSMFEPGDRAGELAFVRAVHRAIYRGLGKIYSDTFGPAARQRPRPNNAVRNRWKKFTRQTRLSVIGAQNAGQVMVAVNKLLANAGTLYELRTDPGFERVHQLLFGPDWRRVQSLALYALASYKRPPEISDEQAIPDADAVDAG